MNTSARGRAVTPEAEVDAPRRRAEAPSFRRDPVSDLRDEFNSRQSATRLSTEPDSPDRYEDDPFPSRRAPGWRVQVRGRFPTTLVGRIASAAFVLAGLGAIGYGVYAAHQALLHDARLTIPSSRAIEISGNDHLTRAQLLSVFGEDVDRNILTVPLADRRTELQGLPWVEHATVMRLLPNRVRVSIVERTPVAFVRQRDEIGLVDAHGVLLDMDTNVSPEHPASHTYSFPVVTGIAASDPPSVRMARMKLYLRFTGELDEGAEKISQRLSEIDLTDPEDVKALIPDDGMDVLVHFGEDDFLARYRRYVQNLPDWKIRYPKLASVDLRYEREAVLEMAPGTSSPAVGGSSSGVSTAVPRKTIAPAHTKKAGAVKKPAVKPLAKAQATAPASPHRHLQRAFDVPSTPLHPKATPQ